MRGREFWARPSMASQCFFLPIGVIHTRLMHDLVCLNSSLTAAPRATGRLIGNLCMIRSVVSLHSAEEQV
eukprot:UN2604